MTDSFLPHSSQIGSYRLCDAPESLRLAGLPAHVLGKGGFGIVYCASGSESGELVAIKEYFFADVCKRAEDGETVIALQGEETTFEHWKDKFREVEAKSLESIQHPNIVQRRGFLPDLNGTSYLIMELLRGGTLERRLDHGALEYLECRRIFDALLRAVKVIHNAKMLHWDIKPQNIVFRETGDPVLLDFGIAGNNPGAQTGLTQARWSSDYCAPEQKAGNRRMIDERVDIYGLGATMVHCVSGKPPVDSDQRMPAFVNGLEDPLAHQIAGATDCPRLFKALLSRMVSLKRFDRPARVGLVLDEVQKFSFAGLHCEPGGVFHERLADGSAGPEMVVIPAGEFLMGDRTGQRNRELPVHRVKIEQPFAMGRYPVTVAEYQAYMDATGADSERDYQGEPVGEQGDHPAVYVSWEDAKRYIDWLCDQTGRRYRLPSEAEWEYATRAGTVTKYWWGDKRDQACANFSRKRRGTSPVNRFSPNPFGLHDTSGNVWEWCEDAWHKDYEGAPTDGSAWLQNGDRSYRVLRGGSWRDSPEYARSSYRSWNGPALRSFFNGFRLLQDI